MLAVDWVGLAASALLLVCVLGGRKRAGRVALTLALGEAGRAALVLLAGGVLTGLTVGGIFTRVEQTYLPNLLLQIGGLLLGACVARLLGRQFARDALVYTLAAGVLILWMPG